MPFNLGGPELIIILVIVLIVFGAGKLPNVMRDFGRGVKEFKSAQDEGAPMTTSAPAPANSVPSTTYTTAPAVQPAPPPVNGNGVTTTTTRSTTEAAPRA